MGGDVLNDDADGASHRTREGVWTSRSETVIESVIQSR
jgi:hypothetical protein